MHVYDIPCSNVFGTLRGVMHVRVRELNKWSKLRLEFCDIASLFLYNTNVILSDNYNCITLQHTFVFILMACV